MHLLVHLDVCVHGYEWVWCVCLCVFVCFSIFAVACVHLLVHLDVCVHGYVWVWWFVHIYSVARWFDEKNEEFHTVGA